MSKRSVGDQDTRFFRTQVAPLLENPRPQRNAAAGVALMVAATQVEPEYESRALTRRAAGVVERLHQFQVRLREALKTRFAPIFESRSLHMAALMMIPGPRRFEFRNFPLPIGFTVAIKDRMLDDLVELLPPNSSIAVKEGVRLMASPALDLAQTVLNATPAATDPLSFWPNQAHLSVLFPLAKMLFAIPASSAEDERSFSSAGFTLDRFRGRLDLESFRKEHRLRRFLTAGTDPHTAEGRQIRIEQLHHLLDRYNAHLQQDQQRNVEQ